MEAEHCESFDSDDPFETSNYHITTTPRKVRALGGYFEAALSKSSSLVRSDCRRPAS